MTAEKAYSYLVRTYHTDASKRLFVHQILNYLQDAAHLHADLNGFGQVQLVSENLFWVLSRLTIEIKRLPVIDDALTLKTWVKSNNGSLSEREYSILINDELVIKASSLWFCISAETQRPVEVPSHFIEMMESLDEYATTDGTEKVVLPEESFERSKGNSFRVQYTDIDMVDHVNNVAYIKWIINEASYFSDPKRCIKSLKINYLAQSFLGDTIDAYHYVENNNSLLHEIKHAETGRILCKVRSEWY